MEPVNENVSEYANIVNEMNPVEKPLPQSEFQNNYYPHMASFKLRLFATIVDTILLFVAFRICISIYNYLDYNTHYFDLFFYIFDSLAKFLISLALIIVYYGYFYAKNGQSIGKMIFRIKVINSESPKYLTLSQIIIRETFGKFLSALILYFGFSWYFIDTKRQTWHDLMAKSYVVLVNENGDVYMDGNQVYKKNVLFAILASPFLIIIQFILLFFHSVIFTILNYT